MQMTISVYKSFSEGVLLAAVVFSSNWALAVARLDRCNFQVIFINSRKMQFSDNKNEGRQPIGVGISEAANRAGLAGVGAYNEFDYEYVLARIGRCRVVTFPCQD